MEIINIPEERKPVLIGKKGKDKKRIEKATKTRIKVGEDIVVEGEPFDSLKALEIIKAIGRGFSPKSALKLIKENISLIIIKVEGTPNTRKRLLARVIGSGGKSKKNIEKLTNTEISVYGKTISIIGEYKKAEKAEKSIRILLSGKTHNYAYRYLKEKQYSNL